MEDRRSAVAMTMKRLAKAKVEGFEKMAGETASRRLEWFEANKDRLELVGSPVRRGYELLLIEYLGIDRKEVPVVFEDEGRIVWRSFNFCPLLEACNEMGLDTREVCRSQERAAEALVAKVDPRLKFSRNYRRIRPHSGYCEEMLEMK